MLELRPAGATLQEQSSGCGDSSGTVYAERIYRPASTADEVVDFYRRAVPAAGWKPEFVKTLSADGQHLISGSRMCFSKTVEGVFTFLSVWFESDFSEVSADTAERDPRDFGLVVRVMPNDLIGC